METDRNKYDLRLDFMTDEALVEYIKQLETDLVRTETFLEIAWEEIRGR
jgi:hypothetical protein